MATTKRNLHFDKDGLLTIQRSDDDESSDTSASPKSFGRAADPRHPSKAAFIQFMVVFVLALMGYCMESFGLSKLYTTLEYGKSGKILLDNLSLLASIIASPFLAGLSHLHSPRTLILWFTMILGVVCLCYQFIKPEIIILGRLGEGVARTILFSIFEVQLINLHDKAHHRSNLYQSFTVMICGAVVVASVASFATDYFGEYSQDIALVFCLNCGVYLWVDNHGEIPGAFEEWNVLLHEDQDSLMTLATLQRTCRLTLRRFELSLCGIGSGCFEAALMIILTMWEPLLKQVQQSDTASLQSTFATMSFSAIAGAIFFCVSYGNFRLELLAVCAQMLALVSTLVIKIASSYNYTKYGMNLFLFSSGFYFPTMGCLKVAIVPDDDRGSIYCLYRLPSSIITLLGFGIVTVWPESSVAVVIIILILATMFHVGLFKIREKNGITELSDRPIPYLPSLDDMGLTKCASRRY